MFKKANFENEIYDSMKKQLVSNNVETEHGFNKLAKAADYLNSAAEIFEQAGLITEASEITEVIQSLTNELNK